MFHFAVPFFFAAVEAKMLLLKFIYPHLLLISHS